MRLIDADELKKAIIRHLCLLSEKYLLDSERTIYNLIDEQPTIEQQEVQQPIKPEIFINSCYCGKCDDYIMTAKQARTPIYRKKARFCCHCGQPIDWQEFE